MKQKLKTALAFTKNVFTTGALSETSRKVELEICHHLPTDKDITVVEFGMGHGNLTREILNTISSGSKLFTFEVNKEFCDHVHKTLPDPRLTIINDGAENLTTHVSEKIQGVIASIPFSFFSEEKGLEIIQNAYDQLEINCFYSQVLYTKFNFKKFQTIFDASELKKLSNFPPEYIYHCQKLAQ